MPWNFFQCKKRLKITEVRIPMALMVPVTVWNQQNPPASLKRTQKTMLSSQTWPQSPLHLPFRCGWSTSPSCTPSSARQTIWSTGIVCLTCRGRCRGFSGRRKTSGRTKGAEQQSRWISWSCSRSSRSSRRSRTSQENILTLYFCSTAGRHCSTSPLVCCLVTWVGGKLASQLVLAALEQREFCKG